MDTLRLRTRLGVGLLLLYVAIFTLFVAFSHLPLHRTVLDVMSVGIALAAACLCGLAALKAEDRFMRWYWGFFALAYLCSSIAEATWAVYESLLHLQAPYPSVADAARLAFYPLVFVGFMRLTGTRARRRMVEAVSTLDALLFSLAGAGLAWNFLVVPAIHPQASSLANLTGIGYPMGDLLLLGALASLAFSPVRRAIPRGTAWVVGSFVVMLVADIVYTRMVTKGTYATGAWVDPLWPLSYALIGAAALVHLNTRTNQTRTVGDRTWARLRAAHPGSIGRVRGYMPYAAVLVAAYLSYAHFVLQGGVRPLEDVVVVVITSLIPILVLTRQLIVGAENRRLNASLVEASGVLEARVVERTEELAAERDRLDLLNQVAGEISRCVTVEELLDAGARLLARATHREGVAISAHDQQGAFHFATGAALAEPRRQWLKKILRKFLAANAGTSDEGPIPLSISGTPVEEAGTDPVGDSAAVLVFPLMSKQAMLGVAGVTCNPGCGLSSSESSLVRNIAAQLAVAIEVAHRYDDARFMANSDSLTGLANRRSITERLEQEVARTERARGYFAVIMMDLDNFKQFNDTYGHPMGDQALVATSAALRQAIRTGDTVGRLGGDEFLAILPDTGSAGAVHVVERIKDSLADRPLNVSGKALVTLHATCGVAVYPVHGRDAEELLRVADENMYFFKRHGDKRSSSDEPDVQPPDVLMGAFDVLDGLIDSVDVRDHYTRQHSDTVAKYAMALAERLGLSAGEVRSASLAGLLHDVGKIGVPDRLLREPGPLSYEEYEVIRQHSRVGRVIVSQIPSLRDVLEGVAGHHERYDGQGYPDGLRGEDIPVQARILAAADAYAAMTATRPYAPALAPAEARAELRRVSGTQLDPLIVAELLAFLDACEIPPEVPAPVSVLVTES